jgi:hypothetical protein
VSSGFGGFAIRGFRRFYQLQRICLPGKLNVLAGDNNSGKSNVLLAADRILGPFGKAHGDAPSVDVLDRSQVGDSEPGHPHLATLAENSPDEHRLPHRRPHRGTHTLG